MCQKYHTNAKTNEHTRRLIQASTLCHKDLADKFGVSTKTISKHKKRKFIKDKSSRPDHIYYSLTSLDKEIIASVRRVTWMDLDDLVDIVTPLIPLAKRSNVYRTLVAKKINQVPEEKKKEAKKFKEYKPGYLHIDVTYLPQLNGSKHYLFVAIDRATRLLYYKVCNRKTAANAVSFLEDVIKVFPFYITHVLTDNGLEFTDKFIGRDKNVTGNHKFDLTCKKEHIEHRLTQPSTPKTNGMVERVNGTIKNKTIKTVQYENLAELKVDVDKFLIYYNFNRAHGGLRKELKVRTPFEALHSWYQVEPEIFKVTPDQFRINFFDLVEQRSET
jgi:transposase-like protein